MAGKTNTPTLTPEQQAAARKEAKAAKERQRRAEIKAAEDALAKAELPKDTELTIEQRKRAAASGKEKGGLAKKALARWILEGKDGGAQIDEAQAAAKQAAKAERTRANVTRSGDPEAAGLAAEAKSLAPEVKSAFLPKDAREFIDLFRVTLDGDDVVITRTDGGGELLEGQTIAQATIPVKALEAFARKGEKDGGTRLALSKVGKGSRLWGRKLGLMALAQRNRIKGATK